MAVTRNRSAHGRARRRALRCLALGLSGALSLLAGCGNDRDPSADPAFRAKIAERANELDPRDCGIGRRIDDLEFTPLDGEPRRLSQIDDAKAITIVLRDVGCPVSKRQGPALARLEKEYSSRGVAFLFLNPSEHNTREEMRGEVEDYGFEGPYAHDPEMVFPRSLGARTTTDVFVLDRSRTLVYRGAIDDQVGRGTSRTKAEREYLADALDAVLDGSEVEISATNAPGCFLDVPADDAVEEEREVTYHRDVSRILQRDCVECHRAGGAGPFALDTYASVRGRRGMVRFVVDEGIMPPWFANDEGVDWKNDARLSERDRATILDWIAAGCPEGDPADAPVPVEWKGGWLIGEPDHVFRLSEPFHVPAEGVVDLQHLYADVVVPEDLWIEAMQLLPTDPEVVHHATLLFKPPKNADRSEDIIIDRLVPWARMRRGWVFLMSYLPGKGPQVYRDGVARFLPKGSRIRFEMHYTSKGTPTVDHTALGIRLADGPPDYVAETRMLRNFDIFIPAGAARVHFGIDYTVPETVVLRSLTPHMHLVGRTFHVELTRPGGESEPLLQIPEWDPDWQFSYQFRDEPLVEAGSRIHVDAWFDNSEANLHVEDPSVDVTNGPQIWDEMLMLLVEWVAPRERG